MTNKNPNEDTGIFSWKANRGTNIPIFFALAGMIYATLLLYGKDGRAFHDLYLQNKKPLVREVIQNRIDNLRVKRDSLKKYVIDCPTSDCDKIKKEALRKITELLLSSQRELIKLENFNTDTSLKFFSRYFSTDREKYLDAIRGKTDSIPIMVIDTSLALQEAVVIKKPVLVIAHDRSRPGLVDYFDKYPLAGFWFAFSIVQAALWFLIIPVVIGSVRKCDKIGTPLSYNLTNAVFFTIIPLLIVAVLIYFTYLGLANSNGFLIDESFFLSGFNTRMAWYGAPGYFAIVICLGIYIFMGNKLELLNNSAIGKKQDITKNRVLMANYISLKSSFDFAFSCSALILSVFVLWLGILFNAVNGIEALNFYTLLSGKAFLSYDFVYLTGILHTLILLIFYIPVKLQFNSLPISQQLKSANTGAGGNSFLKTIWDATGTVLITASPLITTVLQKLITGFAAG